MKSSSRKFEKGCLVKSSLNRHMTYRVQACGQKRATLVAVVGGYFRCYCPVSLLSYA